MGANPVRPDNRTMPHTWDILLALFQPAQRNGPPFIFVELKAALMTLREAFVGFLIGGAVGFGLGVLFVRSTMSERAFMPYVVASQTVPIIAIAPMVVVWGGRVNLPQWLSVSLIAAYLTFFPVAINTLRGLRSPHPTSMELMRSYASSPRGPLEAPGPGGDAIHIHRPQGLGGCQCHRGNRGRAPRRAPRRPGRDLLQFSQQFTAAPEKLFAADVDCRVGRHRLRRPHHRTRAPLDRCQQEVGRVSAPVVEDAGCGQGIWHR